MIPIMNFRNLTYYKLFLLLNLIIFSCSKDDSDSSQPETNLLVKYDVSISSSEGGRINIFTRNGGNTQSGTFAAGTVLKINATPDDGYKFIGWTGSNETSMEITITVNSNISLQAIFSKIFSYNSEEYSYVELSEPPYGGTIFITGNIITPSNKTVYDSIVYKGIDSRFMYDRRNGGGFIDHNPFLYDAYFSDGLVTEIQINSEFSIDQSLLEAEKYGFLLGQLSKGLRKHVETMWIHKGEEAYGGGNNNILVHTGMSEFYENYFTGNIIEETLIHEATHTSIDAYIYPDRETNGEGWINAVDKDNCYISDYARDYPYREDLAELMPLYIAVKFFPNQISEDDRNKILSCCINRILYLDSLSIDFEIYNE